MKSCSKNRPLAALASGLAVLTAAGTLSACAPLLIGGAMVGTALVVTDRRTPGAQLEDQGIELKAADAARKAVPLGHVNVTSYNRMVMITGEVPAEADRSEVERAVARVENVRSVVNELAVAGSSSMTSRSNDALITSKVKASMIDSGNVDATAVKVVTERAIVYLMGLVTEAEAERATALARTIPGVQKVVRVFEMISQAELKKLRPSK